jgi:sugar lactone lactonase YvrE
VLGNADNPYGLVFPTAVTTDLHRRVWIADSGTASVHVFDRDSGAYREIKRVSETQLQRPSGITSDSQGRVYLTDSASGGVYVFDEQGEYDHSLTKHSEARLESPGAIALSTDSKTIYVADPPRDVIVELNREGEVNGTIALPPEFGGPTAISIIDNQVYVLGGRQHRVGIFSPSGFFRGELRWDGVAAPTAFAFDPIRRRFVAANPRWMVVQLFKEDGGNLATFGQAGDGVDQMQRIDSLHVDAEGTIYIVDSLHGKVLAFAASQ